MGNDYLCVFVVHMLSVMFLCDHVNIDKIRCGLSDVELGKFDPPLWHAPYGRIV